MATKITNKQIKIISTVNFNDNEITNALINANNNTITNLTTSDLENDSGFVTSADVNSEIIANSSTIDNILTKNSYKAVTNDAIAKGIDLNKVSVVDSINSSVEPLPEPTGLNQSILRNTYYDKEIYTSTYKKSVNSFYTQTGGTFNVNGEGKIEGFTDTATITKYFQNWGGVKSLKLVLTLLTQTGIFSTPIFLITRHDDNSVLFGIDLEGSYAYQRLHFYTKQRDGNIVDEAYCKVSIKTSETGGITNTIFTIEITSSGYIKLTGNGKTELIRYFNSLLTSDNVESDFYYNLDVDTTIKSTIAIPNINPPGRFGISQLFGLESYIEYNYMTSQGKNYIVRSNDQEFMWDVAVQLEKNKLIYNIADDSLYKFDNTLTKILSNVTYTAGNGIDIISNVISLQDSQLIPDQTEQANKFLTTNGTTASWAIINYNDLTNKPTIPTVNNNTITITQGGTTKGSFTLNQDQDSTIELDASAGYHTTQLSDNTDLDTITTEGNYFIKSPTSTKGMPELPTSVSYNNDEYPVAYWLCLLLVEKEFGYGTNFIRQTITLTPFCSPSGSISGDTLIFTRTLISGYYQIDSKWTKIDGDITNLNISIYSPQTSYILNNLRANYCYKCGFSNYYDDFNVALTSLTLTNIQNTADEIRVMFKVGDNFTLTATQLTFLNYTNLVFESGKKYILTIKNLYATIDNVGNNTNLENLIKETALPSQTGQSGKFLTTNGTTTSWVTKEIKILNVVQTGTLTRNGAVYSGFSGSNYLQLGNKVNGGYISLDNNVKNFNNFFSTADSWEINGSFKLTDLSRQYQHILGTNVTYGLIIGKTNSGSDQYVHFDIGLSGGGNLVSFTYTGNIDINTKYYFRWLFTGTEYKLWINTDGETYDNTTLINTVPEATKAPDIESVQIGHSAYGSYIDGGEIDIADWSIKKNGEYWWKGVETI